jgi:hypothetical protein
MNICKYLPQMQGLLDELFTQELNETKTIENRMDDHGVCDQRSMLFRLLSDEEKVIGFVDL